MKDRYLSIYLRDHYAMAQAGIDFFERIARQNRENVVGDKLDEIIDDLEDELMALKEVLELLHIEGSPVKTAGMRLATRAGLLKLNGNLIRYSPLSRLEELEFAMAATTNRRGLWMTLSDARFVHPVLDEVSVEVYIARADRHLEILRSLHDKAARTMLKKGREERYPGGRPRA